MSGLQSAGSVYAKMLAKMDNETVYNAIKLESPLLDSGMISKKDMRGRDIILNLSDQGARTAIVKDGGTKEYGQQTKTQQRLHAPTVLTNLELGVDLVEDTQSVEQAADQLEDELKNCFENAGQTVDQLIIGDRLATVAATVASGVSAFTVSEFGALRPNQKYAHLNSSGAEVQRFVTGSIVHAANPNGPHTVNLASGTTLALGMTLNDTIVVAGQLNDGTDDDREFASMQKAIHDTNALYGLPAAGLYNWAALRKDASSSFSITELKLLENMRHKLSRKRLKFACSNSLMEEDYIESFFDTGAHYMPGGSPDVRKHSSVRFKRAPWIIDENMPDEINLVGENCVELCQQGDAHIVGLNRKKPPSELAAFLNKDRHVFQFSLKNKFQLRWKSRMGCAQYYNIGY